MLCPPDIGQQLNQLLIKLRGPGFNLYRRDLSCITYNLCKGVIRVHPWTLTILSSLQFFSPSDRYVLWVTLIWNDSSPLSPETSPVSSFQTLNKKYFLKLQTVHLAPLWTWPLTFGKPLNSLELPARCILDPHRLVREGRLSLNCASKWVAAKQRGSHRLKTTTLDFICPHYSLLFLNFVGWISTCSQSPKNMVFFLPGSCFV